MQEKIDRKPMQSERTSSRVTKSSASSLEEQRKAELVAACAAAAEAAAEQASTKVAAAIAEKYEKHISKLESALADQIATSSVSSPPPTPPANASPAKPRPTLPTEQARKAELLRELALLEGKTTEAARIAEAQQAFAAAQSAPREADRLGGFATPDPRQSVPAAPGWNYIPGAGAQYTNLPPSGRGTPLCSASSDQLLEELNRRKQGLGPDPYTAPPAGPPFPGPVALTSQIERPQRLKDLAAQGYHVNAGLFQSLEYSAGTLLPGYSQLNPGSQAELEVLYPVVARIEDVLHRYQSDVGGIDSRTSDGVYMCLYDVHQTLYWRFDFIRKRARAAAKQDPQLKSEKFFLEKHATQRLERMSQFELTSEEEALEKQIQTAGARMEAWNLAKLRYAGSFGNMPSGGWLDEGGTGGGGGGGAPAPAPAPGAAAQPLRRGR